MSRMVCLCVCVRKSVRASVCVCESLIASDTLKVLMTAPQLAISPCKRPLTSTNIVDNFPNYRQLVWIIFSGWNCLSKKKQAPIKLKRFHLFIKELKEWDGVDAQSALSPSLSLSLPLSLSLSLFPTRSYPSLIFLSLIFPLLSPFSLALPHSLFSTSPSPWFCLSFAHRLETCRLIVSCFPDEAQMLLHVFNHTTRK